MGLEAVSQMLMNCATAVHYIKEHVHVISSHRSPILLRHVFDKVYYFNLLLTNVHTWMTTLLIPRRPQEHHLHSETPPYALCINNWTIVTSIF